MKKVAIVGGAGGSNIGQSFLRAAPALGIDAFLIDHAPAFAGPRLLRRLLWAAGRRPYRLETFTRDTLNRVLGEGSDILIATGTTPIRRAALETLSRKGVTTVNVSTDDPWNPAHRAAWFLDALPAYDLVLTPRASNLDDFRRLGCRDVRYLPFGFDDALFAPPDTADAVADDTVLFVGGADADRAQFFAAFLAAGTPVMLAGSYWERYPALKDRSLGQLAPAALVEATARAAVNLCLVRRANRDGHVMRSYEIAAVGGFMIAEDTQDHRRMFGPEGEGVLYFSSAEQAAEKARWALAHPRERQAMAEACHKRIAGGENSYRDRLRQILAMVAA